MIRLPLAVFCVACLTLSAQAPAPTSRDRMVCLNVGVKPKLLKCWSTLPGPNDQKPEIPELRAGKEFARTAKIGSPWPGGGSPITFIFEANRIQSDGPDLRLTGNAEINTTAIVLHADEAVYHRDSGEIEGHGSLRVRPL